MSSSIEILYMARRLLAHPMRWTRWAAARDSCGRKVEPDDSSATAWCLAGALLRCGSDGIRDRAIDIVEDAIMRRTDQWQTVSSYNDDAGRVHADILAVLDDAIRWATDELMDQIMYGSSE